VTKTIFSIYTWQTVLTISLHTVITTVIHVFAILTLKNLNLLWLSLYQQATWKLNMHLSLLFHTIFQITSVSDSKDSF